MGFPIVRRVCEIQACLHIFFTTLLIYLGVTLLGWGLDNLVGYFSLAPRRWETYCQCSWRLIPYIY